MREAIQQERGPLFIATPAATPAGRNGHGTCTEVRPTTSLDWALPSPVNSTLAHPLSKDLTDDTAVLVKTIAAALAQAQRPLVVSGTSLRHAAILQAAAQVAWACAAPNTRPICP